MDSQHSGGLFSERVSCELTNARFNNFSYYVEEDNLSRIMCGLRVEFIIRDDVQNLSVSFVPNFVAMI